MNYKLSAMKTGEKVFTKLEAGGHPNPEETRLAVVVGCLELVDLVSTNIICSLFWLSGAGPGAN